MLRVYSFKINYHLDELLDHVRRKYMSLNKIKDSDWSVVNYVDDKRPAFHRSSKNGLPHVLFIVARSKLVDPIQADRKRESEKLGVGLKDFAQNRVPWLLPGIG